METLQKWLYMARYKIDLPCIQNNIIVENCRNHSPQRDVVHWTKPV